MSSMFVSGFYSSSNDFSKNEYPDEGGGRGRRGNRGRPRGGNPDDFGSFEDNDEDDRRQPRRPPRRRPPPPPPSDDYDDGPPPPQQQRYGQGPRNYNPGYPGGGGRSLFPKF